MLKDPFPANLCQILKLFSFTNENTFFKNEILYLANENTFFTNEKSNRYILFLFENSFHLNVDQR